nr:ABC transporter substrate-binding protein [Calothrix sp. 336/3]
MQKIFYRGAVFLLSCILIACSTTNQNISTPNPNKSNTPVSITSPSSPSSASRIVALSPIAADIIYELDKTKLVGMAGSSLLNQDGRFQTISRVSEGRTPPNLEKIIALKPDLAIVPEGFYQPQVQKLKELGVTIYSYNLNNWQSLEKLTQDIANYLGVNAQPLLTRYESFLANKPGKETSTLVLTGTKPIISPNKNSWAGDILKQLNIKNVTAELQGQSAFKGYVTLSAEKILEINPDVIILINTPPAKADAAVISDWQKESFWQNLKATKNNQVYVFDYHGLINAGSIDSIEKTLKRMNEVFSNL